MTFEEILVQAIAVLQRRGRLTYRALKRQFDLDDAYLDDLKHEIIEGQRLAVDEQGTVLVWTGAAEPAPASVTVPERTPLVYTPPHLMEKILAARADLEGERKQVTVLFADLKGSTELMRVGLNAGEVVVRTIGNDLHMDYSAVGRTTHLAARMEQLATPGNILLTATTLRLVEGLVRVNALGPVPVKGLTEPVEVCELVGASGVGRRLQSAVT